MFKYGAQDRQPGRFQGCNFGGRIDGSASQFKLILLLDNKQCSASQRAVISAATFLTVHKNSQIGFSMQSGSIMTHRAKQTLQRRNLSSSMFPKSGSTGSRAVLLRRISAMRRMTMPIGSTGRQPAICRNFVPIGATITIGTPRKAPSTICRNILSRSKASTSI
jgi:hypothetical protein